MAPAMADMSELKIPAAMRPAAQAIIALTDQVCPELLDEEYAGLARSVVAKLARKRPSPIQSGRASTWAGGVVYALGQVNFLFDPDTKPYATEFLREEMVATSPMVWFIEVDGLIMDARQLPPAIQAQAFELGVIPYIPALGRDGTAAWLSQSGR
jgi:Domain of unknown function (DUF6398)